MTEAANLVKYPMYLEDMGLGAGTTSVVIQGVTYTRTLVDTRNFPVSAAMITALGLSAGAKLDAAITALGVSTATTSVAGKMKISTAAADPIALITTDAVYGYIPTSTQKVGLGVAAGYSPVLGIAYTPSATNGYLTTTQANDILGQWGTGKDGAYSVGTIVDPATAPSSLTTSTTGGYVPAATYTYKVTYGNASGESLPSSASSTITTTGSTSIVSMTIPVGGTNTTWRKIYRDNGSSSWKLVGYIPDNTTTTFTDTLVTTDSTTAPGSNTTSTTVGFLSGGEFHFTGDTTLPALTLTGDLVLRVKGYVTIGGAVTGTGGGAGGGPLTAFTGVGTTFTYAQHYWPPGFGTNYRAAMMPGSGGAGIGANPGALGKPGATLIIYAYGIKYAANVTSKGAAGGNAGAAGSGGGGGAGAIVAAIGRDYVYGTAVTVDVTGGAGGNGAGGDGTHIYYGGLGGGGGLFLAIAPIIDVSAMTITKNAGASGTNSGSTGSNYYNGGSGGSCAGDGGAYSGGYGGVASTGDVIRAATAGQSITKRQHDIWSLA
jgi:hypothetical protein